MCIWSCIIIKKKIHIWKTFLKYLPNKVRIDYCKKKQYSIECPLLKASIKHLNMENFIGILSNSTGNSSLAYSFISIYDGTCFKPWFCSVPWESDARLTSRLLLGRALFWVNCFIAVQLLAELQLLWACLLPGILSSGARWRSRSETVAAVSSSKLPSLLKALRLHQVGWPMEWYLCAIFDYNLYIHINIQVWNICRLIKIPFRLVMGSLLNLYTLFKALLLLCGLL